MGLGDSVPRSWAGNAAHAIDAAIDAGVASANATAAAVIAANKDYFTVSVPLADLSEASTSTRKFQMPCAATLVEISAYANGCTAATAGTIDVVVGGNSVFDAAADIKTTAGVSPVVKAPQAASAAIADNAVISVVLTQTGAGATDGAFAVLTFKKSVGA